MKIGGKVLKGGNLIIVPILRQEGNFIFKAKSVSSMDEFDKICPTPEPPMRRKPGEPPFAVMDDPAYVDNIQKHSKLRVDYMIVKSLDATDNLEWDTVVITKPETWKNYEKDLKAAGINDVEMVRLIDATFEANSLNEEKIIEARNSFLASVTQEAKAK